MRQPHQLPIVAKLTNADAELVFIAKIHDRHRRMINRLSRSEHRRRLPIKGLKRVPAPRRFIQRLLEKRVGILYAREVNKPIIRHCEDTMGLSIWRLERSHHLPDRPIRLGPASRDDSSSIRCGHEKVPRAIPPHVTPLQITISE